MCLCAPESTGQQFVEVLELSEGCEAAESTWEAIPAWEWRNGSLSAAVTSGEMTRADPQGTATTQGLERLSR